MSAATEYLAPSVDPDFLAMVGRVLADHGPTLREPSGAIGLDRTLWSRLDGLGLVALTRSESDGGSGAGWPEAAALVSEAARQAVALPVGEHDLMAGFLLGRMDLHPEEGVYTAAVLDEHGVGAGVPWGSAADRLAVAWPTAGGWVGAAVAARDVVVDPGRNLLGEPRDGVHVDLTRLRATALAEEDVAELQLRGALVRAIQVVAALERILELTVHHTTTRVQFGRTLSRFQAVQQQVADLAAEVTLARAAVDSAVRGFPVPDRRAFLVAVARSCCGQAASIVVRAGHQLHGAAGTTLEHELHRHTLGALAWRSEFGSSESWDERVAQLAYDAGSGTLWPLIVG